MTVVLWGALEAGEVVRFEIGCHRSMLLVVCICCSFIYSSRVRWKRGAGSLELVDVMEEELSSILACVGPHICRTRLQEADDVCCRIIGSSFSAS